VIFTTAFDQHALAAFDAHAVDYVLKPFKATRLHEAVQRARDLIAGRGAQEAVNRLLKMMAEREREEEVPRITRIPIRTESRTIFVKIEEVDWIEAAGNYMVVHAGEANHILRETMATLEQQLPEGKFLRVNRSTIVNLDRVRELHPLAAGEYAVKLKNGAVITMSRGVREVEQWLKFH
jgi:two-component system, LytTR family, response regulator